MIRLVSPSLQVVYSLGENKHILFRFMQLCKLKHVK